MPNQATSVLNESFYGQILHPTTERTITCVCTQSDEA